MKKEEKIKFLEEKLIQMQSYETQLRSQGVRVIGGVDEVGRGPLAGPVVTACVILPENFRVLGIDDSKKLSEKKREELYDKIIEGAVAYGIGSASNNEIDEINILQATKKAMAMAIDNADKMVREKGYEGIEHLLIDALTLKDIDIPQTPIVKGDSKSLSIAAASIVAKVTRDRQMVKLHEQYPYYGFDSNKGYGTKAHYQGIEEKGITPFHRKSFLKNVNY